MVLQQIHGVDIQEATIRLCQETGLKRFLAVNACALNIQRADAAGFGASRKSIGADGVWGSGRSSGPGACMLASHVAMGARVGAGSLVAHCDVGALATVGSGCLLHDVDLPAGVVVPAGVFMHCVPLNEAAAVGAGVAVGLIGVEEVSHA